MTREEMATFLAANPEIDRAELAVLCRRSDGWVLCVGETQADGVFRHVDVPMEDGMVDGVIGMLRRADPVRQAVLDAQLNKILGRPVQ